jgi:hypothetical protein
MFVNDHFEISEAEQGNSSAACVDWLFSSFDESIATSKAIITDMQHFMDSLS